MRATALALSLQLPLLVRLTSWLRRRKLQLSWPVWFALLSAWLAHYLHGVRRVKVHLAKAEDANSVRQLLQRIVAQCPTLHAVYWPTFYAYTDLQQFLLLGLKEIRCTLQRSVYRRQILQLRDTSHAALDWVDPRPELVRPDSPVVILLHGAIQDSRSATMKDMAVELARRGLTSVVMNRRGYGNLKLEAATARMALYGIDEDLDEVLLEVGRCCPGRPVAIVGFSCGSGFAGRYAAVRAHLSAWSQKDPEECGLSKTIPRILCAVCYDAGYHVIEGPSRVSPPYRWVLDLALRYQYAFLHRNTWAKKSPSAAGVIKVALNPTRSFGEVYAKLTELAGYGCAKGWLERQQPSLEDVRIPCLLINSRDDPICVWENVEDHEAAMRANPFLAHAELHRGAHGCKFDFWGLQSVGNVMIGEFILGAAAELEKARSGGNFANAKQPRLSNELATADFINGKCPPEKLAGS